MQKTVNLLSWQFAILLVGLTIAVSGGVIAVYELYEPRSSGYGGPSLLLGTTIILYGAGMTLFKARILSLEGLIFGLVSLAYLGVLIAFFWWLSSVW